MIKYKINLFFIKIMKLKDKIDLLNINIIILDNIINLGIKKIKWIIIKNIIYWI